jgi:hypothetical protein
MASKGQGHRVRGNTHVAPGRRAARQPAVVMRLKTGTAGKAGLVRFALTFAQFVALINT